MSAERRRTLEEAERELAEWRASAMAFAKRALEAEAVIEAARARSAEFSASELALMLAVKTYAEWKP